MPRTGGLSTGRAAPAIASVSRVSRHAPTHLDNLGTRRGTLCTSNIARTEGLARCPRDGVKVPDLGWIASCQRIAQNVTGCVDPSVASFQKRCVTMRQAVNPGRNGGDDEHHEHHMIKRDKAVQVIPRTVVKGTWMGLHGALKVGF